MDERNVSKPAMRGHKLVLNNRTASLVTGVKDVLSFDLNEVLLETEQGMLMVKGTDLHVNRLSLEKREKWICPEILTVLLIRMCMQNKNRERIYLHVCFVNVCGKLQESQ
mgnify:CR=1 FL=1